MKFLGAIRAQQWTLCLLALVLLFKAPWARSHPIEVEMFRGFPPYLDLDRRGSPIGFSVELLNAIAKEEQLDLHWKVEEWSRSLVNLSQGRADILPTVAYSSDRNAQYGLSNTIITTSAAVFRRKGDNSITNLEDLKGGTIIVQRGSWLHDYLMRTGNYHKLLLVADTDEAMIRLAEGEGDCLLLTRLPGLTLIRQRAIDNVEALNLKFEGLERTFVFAVNKDSTELLNSLNRGLATVRHNGVYDRLFEQWIMNDGQTAFDQQKDLKTLYIILAFTLAVLGVATVLLWFLRFAIYEKTQELRVEVEDRKSAETSALINAEKFRGVLESSMHGMFISLLDGSFTDVNPALRMMLGYTESQLVGLSIASIIHPDDRSAYEHHNSKLLSGEQVKYQSELRLKQYQGAYIWVQVFVSRVDDIDGAALEVVGQIQDVTQAKADEYKLAQQLYDLNFLRDTLDEHAVVARVDHRGILREMNAKGCLISGYDWEDILGLPIDQVFPAKPESTEFEDIRVRLRSGNIWQGDVVRNTKEGGDVYMSVTVSPHQGDDGRHDSYLVVCTDITRQRVIEEERKELKDRLQQAEKMESIGQLTGGIAHDFNNILASILGFTDLTLSKYGDELNEKAVRYLNEVHNAGGRARDLIAQMMAFSRSAPGEPRSVNALPIVVDVLRMLKPTFPSSIEVDLNVEMHRKFMILMDPVKMHQIVMNLMINARDSMGGRGRIEIGLREFSIENDHCASCIRLISGDFIELSIKDNGTGITKATLKKIFDPFFTTKDIGAGTGMGLSVVHGIVHEHEGHIIVDSNEGDGTEFRVLFKPFCVDEPTIDGDFDALGSALEASRIMVVEDEPMVGEYLKELLEHVGYQVSLFDDSQQAWDRFHSNPEVYDMLLTDQTMPGFLGTELIEKVRSVRQDIPIVLCTGYVNDVVDLTVEKFDVQVLSKPIDAKRLLALMPH